MKPDSKCALVTGGPSGIGPAIAGKFSAQGAWVAVLASTEAAKAQSVVADIEAAGGAVTSPPPMCDPILKPGATVVSYSSGGAGYGPPIGRAAEQVMEDEREGTVSRDKARDVYGVAITDVGEIDAAATGRLRSR